MKKSIAGIAVASLLVLAGCGNSQANLPKNDACLLYTSPSPRDS